MHADSETLSSLAEYQDVNVMVILGFGFLCTFLVRYGFSASGFNLLVAAIATQWGIILNGIKFWYDTGKIRVDLKRYMSYFNIVFKRNVQYSGLHCADSKEIFFFLYSIAVAELYAASALISIGAVLGKTNPVHLTLIALLEVSGLVLNKWLLQTLLKVSTFSQISTLSCIFSVLGNTCCEFLCLQVRPLNGIMLLHVFGALFGLMLMWILNRKSSEQGFEKEKFDRKSGLFSMLGDYKAFPLNVLFQTTQKSTFCWVWISGGM